MFGWKLTNFSYFIGGEFTSELENLLENHIQDTRTHIHLEGVSGSRNSGVGGTAGTTNSP